MRFRTTLVAFALLARAAAGQVPAAPPRATGATVGGVVYDSLAHAALADATVQLVGLDDARFVRTARSDAGGRFTLDDFRPATTR